MNIQFKINKNGNENELWHLVEHTEMKNNFIRPELRACKGLFIRSDQGSYYNVITTLNYLLQL
jgi:hypothetical protein